MSGFLHRGFRRFLQIAGVRPFMQIRKTARNRGFSWPRFQAVFPNSGSQTIYADTKNRPKPRFLLTAVSDGFS